MSFDFQPVLRGALVEMRPFRLEDREPLYSVASDPMIWEQHPAKNRCELGGFKEFFRESLASGGALVVVDSESQRIIGSSRFHAHDATRGEVEIGWTFLARSHWGGKYNGQVKQLMLQHAFAFVRDVVFLVGLENLRSQRAVEKIGGVPAGTRLDAEGRHSKVYRIAASAFWGRRAELTSEAEESEDARWEGVSG